MARGCFAVPEMSPSLVYRLLKKVVSVSDGELQQMQSISAFAVQTFHPPAPAETQPKPMPADIHLTAVVAAFLVVIVRGIKNVSVM